MKTCPAHQTFEDENLRISKIRGKIFTRSEREDRPFYRTKHHIDDPSPWRAYFLLFIYEDGFFSLHKNKNTDNKGEKRIMTTYPHQKLLLFTKKSTIKNFFRLAKTNG